MSLNETITLSNGVRMPKLGLGTWMIFHDQVAQAVRHAKALGYRHVDTAEGGADERGVGEGVRSCGLLREEVFVTTKLESAIETYEDTKARLLPRSRRWAWDPST